MGTDLLEPPTTPAEPLEGESPAEQAPPPVPPLEIDAAGKQLTLAVGGRAPDVSQVKLRGGSIAIRSGQFSKGDIAELAISAQCVEVDVVDKIDSQTGEITETVRRHVFRITHVEKV